MQIRIEGRDLPGSSCGPSPDRPGGHHNIEVGLQRRGKPGELLGRIRADTPAVSWSIDCELSTGAAGPDLKGPYIQGRAGARFIYLSWGTVGEGGTFTMFRRAKLRLDAIPADVLTDAARAGVLVGRLGLTDSRGNPVCAAVEPSAIEWSASGA